MLAVGWGFDAAISRLVTADNPDVVGVAETVFTGKGAVGFTCGAAGSWILVGFATFGCCVAT